MRNWAVLALIMMAAAFAFAKSKEPVKGQVVDAGTWGVFVEGRRVASEKFQIEQMPTFNSITTETRTEDGSKAVQRSVLEITSNGRLQHYEWQEVSPGKSAAVVDPSNEFLVEHVTPNPPDKPRDIPFLVSTSTMILDDNIFTHREVLAWRYLAGDLGGSCTNENGVRTCKPAKATFGVLVPKAGVSDSVSIIYAGKLPVTVKGTQQQLNRFDMSSDSTGMWQLWMDDSNKLVMISIPEAHTEVVRD